MSIQISNMTKDGKPLERAEIVQLVAKIRRTLKSSRVAAQVNILG